MKNSYSFKQDINPLLRLAIPLVCTGLVQSAVWFFETLFLARLGSQTLAAGSLVSWLFGTVAVILWGALSSINILVAHKHGEKDEHAIALIARDGVILAIMFIVPAFFLFWYMSPIFLIFGQSDSTVQLAQLYLHALAWGLLANFVMMALLEVIIGVGRARVIFVFSIITVGLNIAFSYLFIFGKLGFPALGIAGAGWGMTVSYWISALMLILYILVNKYYRNYFRFLFTLQKPSFLWELLQIGIPMGFMYCVEVGFFFALTLAMGIFGSRLQAANQVALQYLGIFGSIMFAIAQAVTVRMGHLLGAKEVASAEKVSYLGVSFASISALVIAMVYWILPSVLISMDFNIHDPDNFVIVGEIKKFLAISALFQIFEAARIALFGSLRGLKDTRFTLLISIISFWLLALPLGWLLAVYLQWGSVGFWWGMVIGAAFSVVLLQWRFKFKIRHYYQMENVNILM